MRKYRKYVLGLLAPAFFACQGERAMMPDTVASLAIEGAPTALEFGQVVQLAVRMTGPSGNPLVGRIATWTSSDDDIARVSAAGQVTAGAVRGGAPETVTITVTSDGKSATTTIRVVPIPVATITPSLTQVAVLVGQTVQLGATLRDITGGVLTGRRVTFSTSASGVATTTAHGIVSAVAPGSATIILTAEEQTASILVTVSPVPVSSVSISPASATLVTDERLQLTATARDSAGQPLTGRAVEWSSSLPTVATVSGAGQLTAVAVGTVTITASVEGRTATAVLTIRQRTVASVRILPGGGTLGAGQTRQLTAQTFDGNLQLVTGHQVSWHSSSSAVATVSAQGLVSAIAPGQALITAAAEGRTATVIVTVVRFSLAITINGGGTVDLLRRSTGERMTIDSVMVIPSITGRDTFDLVPRSNGTVVFDRITGAIEDTLQLLPAYRFAMNGRSDAVAVDFVPRKRSAKAIQNAFGDPAYLQYRTSENFIVWWDSRWDDAYYARYILNWAELAWNRTTQAGMIPPRHSNRTLINIYIHHISSHGGPPDGFDDGWGQGVGTDPYGMPFYTAPGNPERIRLTPQYSCCGILHEVFHIMQYNSGIFPYSGDTGWFTEAAAVWFDREMTGLFGDRTNAYGTWNATPFLFMQPQLAMWTWILDNGGTQASFSRGVKKYEMGILLNFLTWNRIVTEDFFYRTYASGTTLTPQEYLVRYVPDFKNAFRRYAMRLTVLDEFPGWARDGIRYMQQFYRDNPRWTPANQNFRPDGTFDDNSFALVVRDTGTTAFVRPREKLEPWSYSVVRIDATTAGTYRITFRGSERGSSGTPADLYLGTVVDAGGRYAYDAIPLVGTTGIGTFTLGANTSLYAVIVNTPAVYSGREQFDYEIKVDRVN
jgi:uncharacterized protein YjdB